jgi:acyl transferase domain-containing protein/acyl carrier protein
VNHLPHPPAEAETLTPLQRTFAALERTRARVAALEAASREPIAVIGIGCRVPLADDPAGFWRMTLAGTDCVGPVPADRWDHAAYEGTDPSAPGRIATGSGGFIGQVDQFDAAFFGIAPREADGMDPQQRLLLEVCWEALEHAGQAPDALEGTEVGVYVGATSSDYVYLQIAAGDPGLLDAHYASGIAQSMLSGRVSYLLGLQGPSVTVDTACSSSLVAAHLACQALRQGDCRLALAGGVNLILSPQLFIALSRAHMLAPDGRCKGFDAAADGFARGEGCGVVVLKRLSDAQADGDRILALIRGSAVNQDGPSSSLTAPNGPAQEAVIRRALARAGVAPRQIGYVEAHGTGTQLGDPLEAQALGSVFAPDRDTALLLGSVKSQIGHLEGAAGVAGLIRLVLSLHQRTIPPHLHFRQPSPHIAWADLKLGVAVAPVPFPTVDGACTGGVSAFGFSGTNAHLVVGEAPPATAPRQGQQQATLLTISARTPAALAETAGRLEAALEGQALADVCRTVNAGRAQFDHRATIAGDSLAQVKAGLAAVAEGRRLAGVRAGQVARRDPPRVAFLFTGQGVQQAGMARGLYDGFAVFRAALDRCAAILQPWLDRPLLQVLFDDAAALERTEYTQPALFAVGYAISRLWEAFGVTPAVVMGHSVGEYVAACEAGVFSLEDGLKLIARRGRLMQSLPAGGEMAAVAAPAASVQGFLDGAVEIAAVNGPAQTVIAGAAAAVAACCRRLEAAGMVAQRLAVSHAFHSPLVDPVLDAFEATAGEVAFAPPRLRLISNLTGALAGPDTMTRPVYWRRHMREPVRFADGVRALAAVAPDVCIEIGPHPVLLSFVKASGALEQASLVPTLRRGQPDRAQFLDGLATLFLQGARITWTELAGDGRVIDLPFTPFQRQRHWFKAERAPKPAAGHALLGEELGLAIPGRVFQARLGAGTPAFLADHVVFGRNVMPATGYLEMLAEVAASPAEPAVWIENLTIGEAMVLAEAEPRLVQTVVGPADETGAASVTISSRAEAAGAAAAWTRHATARIRPGPAAPRGNLAEARARCTIAADIAGFYADMAERGATFGPGFRRLVAVWRGDGAAAGEALGEIALDEEAGAEAAAYRLHPALLDGCLQVIMAAGAPAGGTAGYLPVAIDRVALAGARPTRCWSHAVVQDAGDARVASVQVFGADGRTVALLQGIQMRRVTEAALARQDDRWLEPWLYETRWRSPPPAAPAAAASPRRVMILADTGGVAAALAAGLPDAELARDDAALTGATDVVDLRPLDAGGDLQAAAALCATARSLLAAGVAPRLWIATAGGQAVTGTETSLSAAQASVWGAARTIRLEHPELRPVCIDLDPDRPAEAAAALRAELCDDGSEPELARRGGARLVARLARARLEQPAPASASSWRLVPRARGTFEGFVREPVARREPGPGELEIAIQATGLNFRDVLNVLDLYPGGSPPLGAECAGLVSAVGAGVTRFKPGDAVVAIAEGCLASHVVAPAGMVHTLPPGVGMAEAASFPVAYVTAWFCLHEVGRLRPGERVLIHAGAGGVGLAAIDTGRRLGAEIHATAGAPWKRDLLRSLGVAHVYDSRTPDFAGQVLAATGERGVDLVLNSLSGAMLDASYQCLAPGGRFIEIGKRGIKTAAEVAAMGRDFAYHIVDWSETARSDPAAIEAVFAQVMGGVADGTIRPPPRHHFRIEDAPAAFRMMAQGRHAGRVVLTHHAAEQPAIRRDGTYLISGGLSGLGLAVAGALGEQGAGRLVLVGRRGETPAAGPVIASLRAEGVRVETAALDIADATALAGLLARLRQDGPPLRGVIHAASVQDNAAVLKQDAARFARAGAPKFGGAAALDQLTRADPLDFLVLFSSAASVLGAAGQANYAAANAALDTLSARRRRDGLPALSIAWGAWSQTGAAAAAQTSSWLAEQGAGFMSPAQGLRALRRLLGEQRGQIAVLPMDWQRYRQRACGGRTPAFLREVMGETAAETGAERGAGPGGAPAAPARLRDQLAAAPEAGRAALVKAFVQTQVARALGTDPQLLIDEQTPLGELGLDSLLAIELRNILGAALGHTLPATLVFDYPTIAALTRMLVTDVLGLAAQTAAPPVPRSAAARLIDAVADLSDEELDRQLAARLAGAAGR